MKTFLPYALPDIGEEEITEVTNSLRSGWITTGPKTRQFEQDFMQLMGDGIEAVSVNSATAGLHLGLEALGIEAGDEVITTTYTFTATAEIIRYLGAHPVFVDIDPNTLCIDIKAIESKITAKTKAIIPVHFGGLAVDMEALHQIAKKYNLSVMEDAAHALPSTSHGKLIGTTQSDITIFSFYANKTMTTGEGGMLITRNKKIADRARVMRLHGINRDAFDRFTAKVPSWYYEIIAPGFKYNLTDIAAAIGIHQLKKVFTFQEKRARIASIYNEAFVHLPIILPPIPQQGDTHAWHLYVIQLSDKAPIDRNEFIKKLFSMGIGCSVHYVPLHMHPYWRETYSLTPDMFPISQSVYEHFVSLPIYTRMTDDDIDRVITAVKKILHK